MQVDTLSWPRPEALRAEAMRPAADLVLYLGSRATLADGSVHQDLRRLFPQALLLGCSTGGHALADAVGDDGIVAVALRFQGTRLRLAVADHVSANDSAQRGRDLAGQLADRDLAGVLVLSDGLHVNGSALAAGLSGRLGPAVSVFGGLAGDGAAFAATLVGAGDALPAERRVAAIGFYGAAIRFGHGSAGGWDAFGPDRRITRSSGNVLYELDGAPALDLYERYLGEEAAGLPGTALLFPLRVWDPGRPERDVVRTVLAVDHAARSMTFAGDVPQGWQAQLMRGGIDRLTRGAEDAARAAATGHPVPAGDGLALLVSCIGRRLLMGQRTGEEIEAVAALLPPRLPTVTFYSYGELSPHAGTGFCDLHNQTMTITLLHEAA